MRINILGYQEIPNLISNYLVRTPSVLENQHICSLREKNMNILNCPSLAEVFVMF